MKGSYQKYGKKSYWKHREDNIKKMKNLRIEHPELKAKYSKKYNDNHKRERLDYKISYNKRMKEKVLQMYGTSCKCCGESLKEFLTIDHIHSGGRKQLKTFKNSVNKLRLIMLKNYNPKEYQILCMNCNFSNGKYGYCPHNKRLE